MNERLLSGIGLIGTFIGIILLTIITAFLVNRFFKRLIEKSSEDLQNDPTNYQFLRHAFTGVIYMVGLGIAIYTIPNLRTFASSLLAGAGILAVAVGFASQHALSNIISGVFIVVFKPFRVNDRIHIREMAGVIEDITLRHVVIRDFQNRRIIIPNSIISDEVITNSDFADTKICQWIEIGISYDSDIDKAKDIIRQEIGAHSLFIDNRSEEQIEKGDHPVTVRVISLGDSSVNLRGWAWAKDPPDAFLMQCELLESIKKRFDKEDIEIPFPHRTIVEKK